MQLQLLLGTVPILTPTKRISRRSAKREASKQQNCTINLTEPKGNEDKSSSTSTITNKQGTIYSNDSLLFRILPDVHCLHFFFFFFFFLQYRFALVIKPSRVRNSTTVPPSIKNKKCCITEKFKVDFKPNSIIIFNDISENILSNNFSVYCFSRLRRVSIMET